MSFFIRNKKIANKKDKKKRKLIAPLRETQPAVANKKSKKDYNEDVSSDSDDEQFEDRPKRISESDGASDGETAQEKKLNLAKQYLAEIERQEKDRLDLEEVDKSVLSKRLKDDVLEQAGRLVRAVADSYEGPDLSKVRFLRNGHKLPVTCVALSPDSKRVFTGGKDCCLVKWDLATGKKMKFVPGGKKGTEETHMGHTTHILSLAMSSDGKFLAAGDESKLIRIWDPETLELFHTFKGHRGAVTGLAFRKASHTLYSCSRDRTVKVWDLDEKAYVETLFGHQESITAIDSLIKERALTAGGRDATIRLWKIIEESQLVFQGSGQSIDCIKYLDEQHFVSGSDDGSVCLWGLLKKKPLNTVRKAHGETASVANWITSLAVMVNTDVFATGSQDGHIRVWKRSEDYRKVLPLFTIPVEGFVNSLDFSADGNYLVAGIGQEHRLGRWWRRKEAKNQILIVPLLKSSSLDRMLNA